MKRCVLGTASDLEGQCILHKANESSEVADHYWVIYERLRHLSVSLEGSTVAHSSGSGQACSSMDRTFSRYSNSASDPLPLIPRKSLSVSRTQSFPSTPIPRPATIKVQPPTPPELAHSWNPFEDSDTSASSASEEYQPTFLPRSKGSRDKRIPGLRPPEESTPTPAVFKANAASLNRRVFHRVETGPDDDETPRPQAKKSPAVVQPHPDVLMLPTENNLPSTGGNSTDPALQLEAAPAQLPSAVETLVRKKSGQPVKSSLKSSKPQPRGSLSIVTRGIPSKSEPSTPTHTKAVHFDAHLEHVKLFLAEQKPLAVSRDGSPTDDTSGTDNDFPSFIYGDPLENKSRKRLEMRVTNMPLALNVHADVALEQLMLSQDTTYLLGNVRVRNIDYQKRIVIRFTFDSWQTTSEVAARYIKSLNGGFDRFAFTIRLHDLVVRVEEKTLILAVRFVVQGRELWDNNGGRNYVVRFASSKAKRVRAKSEGESRPPIDLRTTLENAMKGKDHVAPRLARRVTDVFEHEKPLEFKTGDSLASRYDITASLKSPWKPPTLPSPHKNNPSLPSRNTIPWPQKRVSNLLNDDRNTLSPSLGKAKNVSMCSRDLGDNSSHSVARDSGGARDRGCINSTPLTKSTKPDMLPDTARDKTSDISTLRGRRDSGQESGESTPPISSPSSSSRSVSPSPTDMLMTHSKPPHDNCSSPGDNFIDYSQFLNRFCFYTGDDADHFLDVTPQTIPRSHSASSVEAFLSTSHLSSSPPLATSLSLSTFTTPPRTQSFDRNIYRSGSSTPTPSAFIFS